MTANFRDLKNQLKSHKKLIVSYNDPNLNKRISINYDGINNKIQHETDVFILSEAISILIRDYKKRGYNDAYLLRAVVDNLEQNFIQVEDSVSIVK